jgi:hypothetical protein
VLDELGRAVSGARVWLADPTPAVEELVGTSSVEAWRAGSDERGWWWVESDERGLFRLSGVFAREYRVRATDARTLASGEAAGKPGTLLEIVLADEVPPERIRGRVLDERGLPLAGVRVTLARSFQRTEGGSEPVEEGLELAPARTDAAGRFVLPRCARAGTRIELRADSILPTSVALDALDTRLPLELTVARRGNLRVELETPSERADSIALEDGDGRSCYLALLRAWCPQLLTHAPLVEGRSLVLSASLAAEVVVFYRGEEEVGRAPLALRAGELTVLRW